jgi:hypothetical protein
MASESPGGNTGDGGLLESRLSGMDHAGAALSRYRRTVVGLFVVIILATFAAPSWVLFNLNRGQLQVTCTVVEAQIAQLYALQQVRHELGLPGQLKIPELPPECVSS